MKPLRTLIKLYLNSIFRFPVIRHSKDPRERRNAIMGIVAIGIIVTVYGGMAGMTSLQMISAGIDPAVPFLMISAMACVFALAMAFAQGSATLSGFADFDTLMGMPIKTGTVVFARFFALYSVEALYCAAYLLPCGVVYAILCAPAWWFWPAFLVMLLLLPVAPVVIGSGADLLISAAFAGSKYKKGITSAIKMILLLGFIVYAYLLPRLTESFMTAPGKTADIIARIYPPARWFAEGVTGNFPLVLLFVSASAAVCALFVLLLNKTFLPLHDRLSAGYHVKNYRLGTLKRSSAAKALFLIERKRFFNSTAWVINTIFGSILIVVFGIVAAVMSKTLMQFFRQASLERFVPALVTAILIFCATLSPTTCCAISMEGKEIWIAKTLPVPAKLWLRAKLLLNLVLVGPALLITITLLAVFYAGLLSPSAIVGLYLLPVAALLFTTVFGLYINAKLPRLSWKSDTEVVKQSSSVLAMLGVCFGLVAVTVIPMLAIGYPWVSAALAAAVLAASAAVYGTLMKNAEQIRRNL